MTGISRLISYAGLPSFFGRILPEGYISSRVPLVIGERRPRMQIGIQRLYKYGPTALMRSVRGRLDAMEMKKTRTDGGKNASKRMPST